MQVDPETLRYLLDSATFQEHGDNYERNFGHLVSIHFPNSERFWRLFIIPLTERLNGYPNNLFVDGIRFREVIDVALEEISFAHYSAFLNLVYAHQHLGFNMICSLEDIYVHLGCACDLVETFLEKSYLLLLKCRAQRTKVLEQLTKEEFLKIAADWYDRSYSVVHKYYLSKGKSPPIKLPARVHLLKEFICEYLGKPEIWKAYQSHSKSIREFRNVIVHDVQIGRIVTLQGLFVPKPAMIQKYRTLRQFFAVLNNHEVLQRDFVEASQQAQQDLVQLEAILNDIWSVVIQEYLDEFYSIERKVLQGLYGIELAQ